ncbi:rhamnogalacturonan acetylesterase [Streptomyces boncukensis]|uniref:Rhamnogalacturonan acetylesterase n=1 Tax=Streptomyces boncukensis TaxID=2711219 RepID=A0A6G4WWW3_9ACTN|nr:rhamnogalacturonan acetylesterase [Streptomyces boncukensis]NGO69352.1 rhamnogalacturonan acetylesterase [Streptomyces boncukensis]
MTDPSSSRPRGAVARRSVLGALGAVPAAFALTGTGSGTAHAAGSGQAPPTVFIAGDSTADIKRPEYAPEAGWGMALPAFLTGGVAVANHAASGRSSKSFYDEGRLGPILRALRPGDLFLVQFGHNDEKTEDPARGTDPYTTYQEYLRRYTRGARDAGATPVLLTSVERRRFDSSGHALPSHGEYPAAMRALAAEDRVPLIDIQAVSLAEWDRLGPEGTLGVFLHLDPGEWPNYPDGAADNTHFQPHGAIEVARMAARGLGERRLLSPERLRRLDDEVPDSVITWPRGGTEGGGAAPDA